jgi:hypothetical protein
MEIEHCVPPALVCCSAVPDDHRVHPLPVRGNGKWMIAAFTGATLLAVGAGVGIALSAHHQQQPHVAVGGAYSSRYEITVKADDWAYGVALETPWYDEAGSEHLGTRPSCVPPIGYVPNVHVQWVSYRANDATQRRVIAVDC